MRLLGISEYNELQRQAVARLPNRITEAFQSAWVPGSRYPTVVEHEHELGRFVDSGHELQFEYYFDNVLGALTANEFDLFQGVLGRLTDFTEEAFHQLSIARTPLLVALNMLRHLRFLFGERVPRVFELCPSQGYFGAVSMLATVPYAATDTRQAFYLFQNHFLSHVAKKGRFEESALADNPIAVLGRIEQETGAHLPWWQYATLSPTELPTFDAVVCNLPIAELDDVFLRYSLDLAQRFLHNSPSPYCSLLFQEWGNMPEEQQQQRRRLFQQFGFELAHEDSRIIAFAPSSHRHMNGTAAGNSSSTLPTRQQIITEGRAALQERLCIPLVQLQTIYTLLLGKQDHTSADEQFWQRLQLTPPGLNSPHGRRLS